MARGLHLISCYLPNNEFVDNFLASAAERLRGLDQEVLLLTTYEPATDALQYIRVPFELDGYLELAHATGECGGGLLPTALRDAESAWVHRPLSGNRHSAALSACGHFFGRLLDDMEPDTVSVWNAALPQGRLLQTACLARGIPCFGTERGLFPETMMLEAREVGAQSELVLSPVLRSALRAAPAQPKRLAEIRAHYAQRDFSRYPAQPRRSGAELRARAGIPTGARCMVLVLSGAAGHWLPRSLPGMRFSSPWFDSAQSALAALLAAMPQDAFLIVQDHPVDHGHWTPAAHPRLRHLRGEHLGSLFDASDLLAFLGATTVQHEALLTDKPLLLLSRSQLSGLGAAYEFGGDALAELIGRAFERQDHAAQADVVERYVPFLFEHALFGLTGSPARQSAQDFADHLAALNSAHAVPAQKRIERWVANASQDMLRRAERTAATAFTT
jgi:hypothetical protein